VASEKTANRARAQYGASLRQLGAHSIGVEEVMRDGQKTFVVVATFQRKPSRVPTTLTVGRIAVPLVTRIGPPFRPEAI
jgi:hypothetical protein